MEAARRDLTKGRGHLRGFRSAENFLQEGADGSGVRGRIVAGHDGGAGDFDLIAARHDIRRRQVTMAKAASMQESERVEHGQEHLASFGGSEESLGESVSKVFIPSLSDDVAAILAGQAGGAAGKNGGQGRVGKVGGLLPAFP